MTRLPPLLLLLAPLLSAQTPPTYTQHIHLDTAPTHGLVRTADLDRDGDMDLVVGNYSGGIVGRPEINRILLNDGKGRFTPFDKPGFSTVGTVTLRLLTVDIDGDRWVDIVEMTPLHVYIYLNMRQGHGFWRRALAIPNRYPYHDLAVADLDGDRKLDLAILRTLPKNKGVAVELFRQVARSEFKHAGLLELPRSWTQPQGVLFGDMRARGARDLVVIGGTRNRLTALLYSRLPGGGLATVPLVLCDHRDDLRTGLGGLGVQTLCADLDGDRFGDLLFGLSGGVRKTAQPWWLAGPARSPASASPARPPGAGRPPTPGTPTPLPGMATSRLRSVNGIWYLDLDRDGRRELVLHAGLEKGTAMVRMRRDAKGRYRRERLFASQPEWTPTRANHGAWADLDGNGYPDYAFKTCHTWFEAGKHKRSAEIRVQRGGPPAPPPAKPKKPPGRQSR